MGKGRPKRKRHDSVSSIDSMTIDTCSRPGTADPQGQDMMRHHITALYHLSKKGSSNVVKQLIERLVSVFQIQEKQVDEKKEELALQLSYIKTKAEEVEACLQGQISEVRKMVDELKSKTVALEKKPTASGQVFEEGYRVRSLVLSGMDLPTPNHIQNSQGRVHSLKSQVEDILAFLGVSYVVVDCFQMGLHLVKVRFGTREAVQEVLKRASRLRYSPFSKVHIRPSLTAEERTTRSANLRNALHEKKERESRGEHVFIRHNSNFLEFSVEKTRPMRRNAPASNNVHSNRSRI